MPADVAAILERALLSQGVATSAICEESEIFDAASGFRELRFYKCFARASRRVGRKPGQFDASLTAELSGSYPGFTATDFPLAALARLWLLHRVPGELLAKLLERLFEHAELEEQVDLYRVLYLVPGRDGFAARVAEGVRSNMVDVFEAVATHNPLPALVLDDEAWMQMVLKAVFMDRPLYSIYGLDKRASLKLAQKASDYAHERWAAGRSVTPELWRLMAGLEQPSLQQDLERVAKSPNPMDQQAARLALAGPAESQLEAWTRLGHQREEQRKSQSKVEVLYPIPQPS